MRYGNPSIKSKMKSLQKTGCENIVILPLYPQYAAATTATVCDEVYRALMDMRWQPSLQIIPHYESEPLYIKALKNSLEKKLSELNWNPILLSLLIMEYLRNILKKEILTTVIVRKLRDCYLSNLNKYLYKLHFNQDLGLKNGCNLILIKL